MHRGIHSKPTAQRKLEGNPGGRPFNEREPQLPATRAAVFADPDELAGDAIALTEWRRLAPILRRAKQITDGDRATFILFCQCWSRAQRTQERLIKVGDIVTNSKGEPVNNPFLVSHRHAVDQCRKLAAELGLTPASRSRVTRDDGPTWRDDEFDQFDAPHEVDDDGTPAAH